MGRKATHASRRKEHLRFVSVAFGIHCGRWKVRYVSDRASSVLIFPIFLNFPYIFLFHSKTPYNPYNVRLKRQKGILAESCKTDSAHLAFVLSMELIFKKFLCFFQSEGPLINLLRYEMCKLLKLLMDCFLKRDWEESPADSRVFQVRQPTVKFTNRSGWKYSLCPV